MWDGRLFYKNRGWRCGTHHFCLMRATTVAFLLLPFLGAAQGVLINEVAPGEQDGPDWVELHNSGSRSVDLNGATFVSGDALHRVDGALVVPAGGSVVLWFGGDGTGVSHVPFTVMPTNWQAFGLVGWMVTLVSVGAATMAKGNNVATSGVRS